MFTKKKRELKSQRSRGRLTQPSISVLSVLADGAHELFMMQMRFW